MHTQEQIDKIKELGSEWHKDDHHRVYFNDLGTLYGIKTNRYHSGNIQSATLDGKPVSNSQAKRLLQKFASVKFWLDLVDGKFKFNDPYSEVDKAMMRKIQAAIEAQL